MRELVMDHQKRRRSGNYIFPKQEPQQKRYPTKQDPQEERESDRETVLGISVTRRFGAPRSHATPEGPCDQKR